MKKLIKAITESINSTRTDWIALMVKGYGMEYPNMWKLLGYPSKKHYQFDLIESETLLPTVSAQDKKNKQV